MKIKHLINSTYQVVDETSTTVYFQGTHDGCERYIHNYPIVSTQPSITELTTRLDKLEQEVEWTREMVDILEEYVRNIKSSD